MTCAFGFVADTDGDAQLLQHKGTGQCLTVEEKATPQSPFTLSLRPCDRRDPKMSWTFAPKGLVA